MARNRMLGRWRTGGCGCNTPGPDCAGHESDTRRRKRIEQRDVRREISEAQQDGAAGTCEVCSLPDPHNGAGDGVNTCGCLPGDVDLIFGVDTIDGGSS